MAFLQVFDSTSDSRHRLYHRVSLLILMQILLSAHSKRVVFLPVPMTSHARSHANVAREMAAQGHEVWLGLPETLRSDDHRVDTRGIKALFYGENVRDLGKAIIVDSGVYETFWAGGEQDFKTMSHIGDLMAQSLIEIASDDRFVSQLETIRPHLIILDWTPFCHSLLAVPYKLNIPFAFYGSYHNPSNARVPFTTACNPSPISELTDRLTFPERVLNTISVFTFMTYNVFCDQDVINKLVPEKPPVTVRDLSALAEIFVVETDHILDYSRPMLPNTKLIGGSAARPGKQLTGTFEKHSRRFPQGSIVVSFGSSVVNIPTAISEKMLNAFDLLDYGIVWKVNVSSANHSRVLTSSWIPQNDILADNSTKAFVSHCGLNGLYEALYHGVPILCMPMFADQFHNALRIESKGFGVRADLRLLTSQELAELILDVATNETYRLNIGVASKIFRQLYKEPVKEAAFWFDHVMEFGGAYMRFAGQEMPLYQFFLLDVLTFLLALCLIFSVLVYCVCRQIVCSLMTSFGKKRKQE